jgi:hypothetical protein
MIPTTGLNAIADLTGYTDTPKAFAYIAFGSGTTAVATTDTALGTQTGSRVAATSDVMSILKPNDTVRFSGEATPTSAGTMTEIGVFAESSGGAMLLRRLIVPPRTYQANEKLSLVAQVTVKNYAAGTGASW